MIDGCFPANAVVTVLWKLLSSFIAAANSLSVFKLFGALSTKLSILVFTKAVVAIFVVLSLSTGVGATTVPVNVLSPAIVWFVVNLTTALDKSTWEPQFVAPELIVWCANGSFADGSVGGLTNP